MLFLYVIYSFLQENVINSMDFSADGNLLITASDDESMKLYNAETGM